METTKLQFQVISLQEHFMKRILEIKQRLTDAFGVLQLEWRENDPALHWKRQFAMDL